MEPLMTSLEGAIQLLSTSPSTFQVPIGRPSTQPPQFLKLFQKDCETFRQELQNEISLLQNEVQKVKEIPIKVFKISPYEAEVSYLTLTLQKFFAVLSYSQNPGEIDEGYVTLISEWNNLKKYNTKLRILLKFFEVTLEVSCLKTIVNVDVTQYPSHATTQKFWQNYFGEKTFEVEYKDLISALENDYEFILYDYNQVLQTELCSKQSMVTIFRLDNISKPGLYQGIRAIMATNSRKENSSKDDLLETPVQTIEDKSELTKIQVSLGRKLTEAEEAYYHIRQQFRKLMSIIDKLDATIITAVQQSLARDNKVRKLKQESIINSLRSNYKSLIAKLNELNQRDYQERERLEQNLEKNMDSHMENLSTVQSPKRSSGGSLNSSSSGSLHNSNLDHSRQSFSSIHLEPPTDPQRRRSSTQSISSTTLKNFTTENLQSLLSQILHKLKVNSDLIAKWEAQKNFTDRFKIPKNQKLYYVTNATHCFGVLTFPGTLFVYENYICFHRLLRPEVEKVAQPISSISRVLKAISPPFFDTAIQIQLKDKKTSFHFGHLDFRDDVRNLIQLLHLKTEKQCSSEAALIELGIIAVEEIFENQRSGIFGGYSAGRLLPLDACGPWSDEDGVPRTKYDFSLPSSHWQWTSPWVVDKSGHVDEEGWEYSVNWQNQWGPKNPATFVRRRKWKRTRMRLPQIIDLELLTKTEPEKSTRKLAIYDYEGNFSGYYIL